MFQLQPKNVSERASYSLQKERTDWKSLQEEKGYRAYNPDFQPWDKDFCTYRPTLNPQDLLSPTFDVNSFLDVTFDAALGDNLPKASYQSFTEEESIRRPFLAAENKPAQSGREISNYDNQNVVFLSYMQQLRGDPRFAGKSSWELYDYMRKEGMKNLYDEHFKRSANGMGYTTR